MFLLPNEPRASIARAPQPMGGQRAESYYGASSGGASETPRHTREAPSNREASGERRNRSDLKRVVVKTRGRQTVVVVVRAVCGPLRWLTVVVVTEQWWSWFERSAVVVAWSRSWAVDFGLWARVPPWWFGVGVTARGGKVPRPGSTE